MIVEGHQGYYFTYGWEDKGIHTFPNGISSKVNVIARLEVRTRLRRGSSPVL